MYVRYAFTLSLSFSLCFAVEPPEAKNTCFHLTDRADILAGNATESPLILPPYHGVAITTNKVRNQCNFGSCWSHAFLGYAENRSYQYIGRRIPLSISYLYYAHLLEKALHKIIQIVEQGSWSGAIAAQKALKEKQSSRMVLNDGSLDIEVIRLVRKYGLMPESVWDHQPFENEMNSHQVRWDIQSDFFALFLDLSAKNLSLSLTEKQTVIQTYQKKAEQILGKYIGAAPLKQFTYDNKIYTPQTFVDRFFPPHLTQFKAYALKENKNGYDTEKNTALHPWRVDYNTLERTIMQHLNAGIILKASFDWRPKLFAKNPPRYKKGMIHGQDYLGPTTVGSYLHAVQIVGYLIDPAGQLRYWIIKNSWGPQQGHLGHYYLDPQFFRYFLFTVLIPQ